MNLGFWITAIAILVVCGYIVFLIIKMLLTPRWGHIPSPHLEMEELEIPVEGGTIRGFFYTSIDFKDSGKRPGVIVLPRNDKKYPYFEQWGAHYAFQGYPTLVVEVNNNVLKKGDFKKNLASAMDSIKNTICKKEKVDPNKLAYLGIEDAAEVAVLKGLNDEDVKVICCMGMSRLEKQKIPNNPGKVFLAHCENDKVVPVEDFRKNCEILGLTGEDYLLYKFGGHHFLAQEPTTAAYFSIIMKSIFQPEFKQFVNKEVK